jgi:T1SS-143 domain-containing protein
VLDTAWSPGSTGGEPAREGTSANSAAGVTIPDAHLLFSGDFNRAGADLVISESGRDFVVHDYFRGEHRATLFSPDGAQMPPDIVEALTGPGSYAQAGQAVSKAEVVGRVAKVDGDATIMRNGVAVTAKLGDAILKGDVLQTANGQLAVTFNDGSTLNLTANARLVVNEFIYEPNGTANSQLLSLVQGSLTFISGEIAHTGDMKIGTPVATMGIRGTVGGITGANDGTVSFYVTQSDRGAVIIDSNGTIIASVVQSGPMILVQPIGPLQVIAQEVQKSPEQVAIELAALQHIVSMQAVGQQIVQQFFNQDPNNPQTVHTQIQIDIPKSALLPDSPGTPPPADAPIVVASVTVTTPSTPDNPPSSDPPIVLEVPIPVNLPPVIFRFGAPQLSTDEDTPLVFGGEGAGLAVGDSDTTVLTVTLTATNGTLNLDLSSEPAIDILAGEQGGTTITFSATLAVINDVLDGLTFTPDENYHGPASIAVSVTDGVAVRNATLDIAVNPVDDPPEIDAPSGGEAGFFVSEDTPLIFGGETENPITVSDIDSGVLTVTLSVSGDGEVAFGRLSLSGTQGLTFVEGDGDSDATMTFSGTPEAINAALDGLTFTPRADFNGQVEIEIETSDGTTTRSETIEITVQPQNDPPEANAGAATVSEEGLQGGIPDAVGNTDTTDNVVAQGTIEASDPDGDELTFTFGEPQVGLTSNGQAIDWQDAGTGTLRGMAGETTVITAEVDGDGDYTVTLSGPLDHPNGSEEDTISFDVPVNVSDGTTTATTTLTVTVEDDQPVAVDQSRAIAVVSQAFNVAFVLDFSGSIDNTELNTMLEAVKAAGQSLFEGTDGAVEITVVGFASSATTVGSYDSLANFLDAIDNVNPAQEGTRPPGIGSGTNFDAAIVETMNSFEPAEGASNQVFFLSDGQSSLTPSTAEDWEDFVNDNDARITTVGIGNGVDAGGLQEIDVDGSGTPITVAAFDDLIEALLAAVSQASSGNVFEDGEPGARFGADGGRVLSVTVDGTTYTWDGDDTITRTGILTGAVAATMIAIDTALGGEFKFYFAGDEAHAAGDWSYQQPDQLSQPANETFQYGLLDNDGDQSAGIIAITYPPTIDATGVVEVPSQEPGAAMVTGVTIADADAGDNPLTISIVADNGTLNFAGSGQGLTETSDGNDGTLSATGTLAAINQALDEGVTYTPNQPLADADKVALTIDDGNGGTDTFNFLFSVNDDDGATLAGTAQKDIVFATGGADNLTGDESADIFLFVSFEGGTGADIIHDFSGTWGDGDRIKLFGFDVANFEDLSFEIFGDDTEIDLGGGSTITLVDVLPERLSAADFIFQQPEIV